VLLSGDRFTCSLHSTSFPGNRRFIFFAPHDFAVAAEVGTARLRAQAGCNYQFAGGWVIGIQAGYDWTNTHIDRVGFIFPALTESFTAKSVGSVTGRIGYAWDRFLGYFKGGVAWERDDLIFAFPGVVETFTDNRRTAWTIGVGGYAFTNWFTGFVEYDYYNFGTRTANAVCGPVTCFVGAPALLPFDVKETKNVFKVGFNVLLGGYGIDKGPVYGRY
jgi:outer membrane immunogenic protein